jgi:hypothetical protein
VAHRRVQLVCLTPALRAPTSEHIPLSVVRGGKRNYVVKIKISITKQSEYVAYRSIQALYGLQE